IGFAIPSNMAESVMKQLVKGGKVTRGWLGVTIQSITPDLAKEFGLKNGKGAVVNDILKGSPAEKAGLKRGDVILEVNGKTVNDAESLRNIVAQREIGSHITIKIIREGKPISLTAKVSELPMEMQETSIEKSEKEMDEENVFAGFTVIALSQEIAKQLGLSRDEKGVVIIKVESDSAAEEAGLKKGDVIQEINKRTVTNLRDFNNIVSRVKEGDSILLFINRGERKFYAALKAHS
ncbi:MAG: PDZ domain-containing protein, partial [Thermodesulfovibrionia bacterium]|nr:PDZ domain-containing protein [Thermodesulfovibrionia bacterium]